MHSTRQRLAVALSFWKKNLYVVLAMVFVGQASFTLVTPFLPYVLKSMAVTENLATWSGMAYSASFLTSAIIAPVWGSIADKYGKRLQILRSGVGIALTYAIYPAARTPTQFVLLRGLTGFLSGFIPAATSLVATNTPEEHIGYALGLLQASSAAGTISGPLLGGVLVSLLGIPFTFRLSAMVLFAFTVVSFLLLREQVVPGQDKINVLADIMTSFKNRDLTVVLICLFLVQAAVQMTQPTLVLYVDLLSEGKNSTLISGIVYSIAGAGTVLGATLAARAGRNANGQESGVERRFVTGLIGSALTAALHGVWLNLFAISLFRLGFGMFSGILTVAGNVLAARAVPREFRGRAFGVLNGVLPLGAVTGPVIGGAMGDSLGLGSSFYASAGVFLLSALIFSAYMKKVSTSRAVSKSS